MHAAAADLEDARAKAHDCPEVAAALTRMLGVLSLKFAWVHEHPYTVWTLDSPSAAAELLKAHDDAVAAGSTPHRVSTYLAGKDIGSLRADLVRFANGYGLTTDLRVELNAYRLCKLDDTWAESSHRDLSRIGRLGTFEDMAWSASTYRLKQNLEYVSKLDASETRRFAWLFHWWKAIARRKPLIRRKVHVVKPVRMRKARIQCFVYRYKDEALRDWAPLLKPLLDADQSVSTTVRKTLEYDFVQCVVRAGAICTVPVVHQQQAIADAWAGPLREADSKLHAAAEGVKVYGILESGLRRRALVRTYRLAATLRESAWPVLVQPYVAPALEEVNAGCFGLEPLGRPEIMDAAELAPWPTLYGGLRVWQRSTTNMVCHQPTALASKTSWDWRSPSTPVLAMLQALKDRGWTRGRRPKAHTELSPKHLGQPSAQSKPYLGCLLVLQDLLSPTFTSLSARESNGYYECILCAARPDTVPHQAKRSVYTALLRQLGKGQSADALEDGDGGEDPQGPQALALQDVASDDEVRGPATARRAVPKRRHVAQPGQPRPPKRPRVAQSAMWGDEVPALALEAPGPHVPLDAWPVVGTDYLEPLPSPAPAASAASSSCAQPPLGPPALTLGPPQVVGGQTPARPATKPRGRRVEQPQLPPSAPAASAASSSCAPPPPPPPLAEPALGPPHAVGDQAPTRTARKRRAREPVFWLEGQPVYYEAHCIMVASDHYARFDVHCPAEHHRGGIPCMKKRNTGKAQTARFGEMEPFAYLGAWLRLACSCESRKAHVDRVPSEAETCAYATEMGWLPSIAASDGEAPRGDDQARPA